MPKNRTEILFALSVFVPIILLSLIPGNEIRAQEPVFNQENAWKHLQTQCSFGPRIPGTKGHRKCLSFLEEQLKQYPGNIVRQNFMGRNPATGETINMTNLVANFWPDRDRRLLLCAHWDTRPWADQDPDSMNHSQPVLGANDGASGVAVLLEIARCITLRDPGIGVDIVLFDGEDMGRAGKLEEYCQGSRWYARNLSYPLPEAAILLDMVGDVDLHLPQELYSRMSASELLNEVYLIAMQLGEIAFDPGPGHAVYDDHVALLREGIPAIDLIDFDYEYWHTIEDVPANCSPSSLGSVGRVVLEWVYQRGGKNR